MHIYSITQYASIPPSNLPRGFDNSICCVHLGESDVSFTSESTPTRTVEHVDRHITLKTNVIAQQNMYIQTVVSYQLNVYLI